MKPEKYDALLIRKSGNNVRVSIDWPDYEKDLIIARKPFYLGFVVVRGGKKSKGDERDYQLFVFYER